MKKIKKFFGLLALVYLSQPVFSQQLRPFYDDDKTGKYGFKNAQGKVVVTPKYDFVYDFREGMAAVSIGGKWVYDGFYEEDTYKKGKWGFINSEGKEVVPLKYDNVSDFNEGMAAVGQNNKYGYVNKQGLVVIPLKYSSAGIFQKGYAAVGDGNSSYFIDKTGKKKPDESSNKDLSGDIDKVYKNILPQNDSLNPYAEKALARLSYSVLKGQDEYRKKNYSSAFKTFETAAKKGDTEAMVRLGAMYFDGLGTQKNLQQAYDWYLKAANLGNGYSANELGVMYTNGTGVAKNYSTAISWYNKAIEKGITDALFNMGFLYEYGYGVTKNMETAFNWYKKAADKNNYRGAYTTGRCYHYALGTKKDLTLATKYYAKAEDGYSSDPGFYNDVAYCLFENNNFDGALKLLNQAVTIDPQYANGYDSMGEMYFKKGNKTKAIEYYKKAADMGWEGAKKWLKENTGIVGNTTSANITSNLIPFENKNGFWSYKNEQGEVVIPGKFYTAASDFSEGLAAVVKTAHYDAGSENLYGYIDATGKEVIPFEWKYATPFEEGIALVIKGGAFDDGWAMITDGEAGFIDKKGKLLFPLIPCHRIEGGGKAFKNKGKVKVYTTDDTFFYINENGQIVK